MLPSHCEVEFFDWESASNILVLWRPGKPDS